MTKIIKLRVAQLRNNEHFQFMTDFSKKIEKYLATELLIDNLFPKFQELLTKEEQTISVLRGSEKTKLLDELDDSRDKTWKAIYSKTKSYLLSPNGDEVSAAESVMRIMEKYGDIRDLSYNEESGAISNIVDDLFSETFLDAINTLALGRWLAALKDQNDQFQSLFNTRNEELANKDSGNVRNVRNQLDVVYNQITEMINASLTVGIAKDIATVFVTEINEQIDYYNNTLAMRSSSRQKQTTSEV